MKQTAVEWLVETFNITNVDLSHHKLIIEHAKAIEKQQIVDAYRFGIQDEYVIGSRNYYNKTFKSE